MNAWKNKQTSSGQMSLLRWKPPICTRPFQEHSPESFREHILGLYEEVRKKDLKKQKPPYNLRFNAKGTMIITVRRKPKSLTLAELEILSSEKDVPINRIWNYCKKKGIQILGSADELQSKAASER